MGLLAHDFLPFVPIHLRATTMKILIWRHEVMEDRFTGEKKAHD